MRHVVVALSIGVTTALCVGVVRGIELTLEQEILSIGSVSDGGATLAMLVWLLDGDAAAAAMAKSASQRRETQEGAARTTARDHD